jgi:hypothetical protein
VALPARSADSGDVIERSDYQLHWHVHALLLKPVLQLVLFHSTTGATPTDRLFLLFLLVLSLLRHRRARLFPPNRNWHLRLRLRHWLFWRRVL